MLVVVDRGRAVKAKIKTVQLFTVNGLYDYIVDLHLVKDPEWSRERDPTLAHLRTTLDAYCSGAGYRDAKLIYRMIPDELNSREEIGSAGIINLIKAAEAAIPENTNV